MDKSKQKGGFARAAKLSPIERSDSAKQASVARWRAGEVLKATHVGELNIGGAQISCAVLEDGRRVLSRTQLGVLFGRKPGGYAYRDHREAGNSAEMPVFMALAALKPFISKGLTVALQQSVKYVHLRGSNEAVGLPANILPKICAAWMDARKAGVLLPSQERVADRAEIVLRGFAEVGINALVDEATGYQEIRDRHALQEILDKYLAKELAAWAKMFPDEFYKHIFRLRNWVWRGMHVNRPQCVAAYTNDIVYKRLAPAILEELELRNPSVNGVRRARHHQWMSSDVGHPALSQHVHAILGLMRISKTWDEFKKFVDQAYPLKGTTIAMNFD